jgi:hypothetical protein
MFPAPASAGRVLILARPERRPFLAALLREQGYCTVEAGTAAQGAAEIDLARVDLAVIECLLVADLPGLALLEAARLRRTALLVIGDPGRPTDDPDQRDDLLRRVPSRCPPREILAAVRSLQAARQKRLARSAAEASAIEGQIREQVRQHWTGVVARDIEETLAAVVRCCALLGEDSDTEETARALLADMEDASRRTQAFLFRLAETWEKEEAV